MERENFREYSGLSKRIFSFAIDILVVIIANTIFTATVAFIIRNTNKQLVINSFEVLSPIIIYCAIASYLMYFSLLDSSLFNGTVGKRLFKIEVIDANGKRLNLVKAFIRAIIKYISISLLIGIVPIIFTKKRQALHDLLLNTIVILKR